MNSSSHSILTLNVRGLRNAKKIKCIFKIFKDGRYEIIALQETYLLESDVDVTKREWGENFYLYAGTTRYKGLLTLFSKNI